MACRVGITTDLADRERYWRSQYPTLRNWTHISTHATQAAAQAREDEEAKRRGCESSAGGPNIPGPWYVYYFEH